MGREIEKVDSLNSLEEGAFPKHYSENKITSLFPKSQLPYEVERYEPLQNEVQEVKEDKLDTAIRRLLIGLKAFGEHNLSQAASYAGISLRQAEAALSPITPEGLKFLQILKDCDSLPCLTKGEILARLSIEAENSPKGADRIAALKMLMEFRGLSAPEGGSRSFSRTVLRFKK